jgi:hypothetical protein
MINRISELASYLQSLAAPPFAKKVEKAIQKNDKDALVEICESAKIPAKNRSIVVSTLLSMSSPQQKYPEFI